MLVLALPVVGFNDMFADLLGYRLPDAAWVAWVSPLLGTVIYLWGGRPFLAGARDELKQRNFVEEVEKALAEWMESQ